MAKKLTFMVIAMAFAAVVSVSAFAADTLTEIKTKGVLTAGVKDSTPPFGSINPATKEYTGYDIDFIRAIAARAGVKAEFLPVTSANRIPMLQEGRVVILAATMTKTPERAKQIDFSYTYFLTGQKFLTKVGTVKSLKDLEGKAIGTAKGSTSEQNAAKALPTSKVLSFDDYPQAVLALVQGKVVAVTTDESILAGQLGKLEANAATKGKFEIPDVQISEEPYGLGVRQNDAEWLKFVNDTIIEMEKSGEAKKLFDKYFGPNTENPMKRGDFTITADERGIK
jgi:polar amino acid transport system substrate-binding protein